jgi:hypothetical protein
MDVRCEEKVGLIRQWQYVMLILFPDKSGPGVFRAATQYGIRDKMLDCLTFDVTRNPWRRGELLDAIITDPPCTSSDTMA